MKESLLCIMFRITTKRKHNKVTSKTKYEALKELDKNRPNKEVAIQFNVPESTLLTGIMKMEMKNPTNKSHILQEMKLTRQSKL